MMEMKIKGNSLTMRCTVASVTLPCECEGEARVVAALRYFKRVVEDHKGKYFSCTCEDNVMRFGKTAIGGFRLYGLSKGTDFEPDSAIPSEAGRPKR